MVKYVNIKLSEDFVAKYIDPRTDTVRKVSRADVVRNSIIKAIEKQKEQEAEA